MNMFVTKMLGFTLVVELVMYSVGLVAGEQRFIERPRDTKVIRGRSAMMNCSVADRVGYVQWAKGETLLGFELSIPGFPRYSIVQSDPEVFNLLIVNTTIWDDSVYECQVLPGPGNAYLQASAALMILVPPDVPAIVGHRNGSVVNVRHTMDMVQLACQANNSRPAATITWYKNGQEVTDNVEYTTELSQPGSKLRNAVNTLTLTPNFRSNEHNSEYMCKVTNEAMAGKYMIQTVTINVQFPPSMPEITGYRPGQIVRAGDSLALECVSRGGNPLAQVVWFKNNEKIDFSYSSSNDRSTNELTFTVQAVDNSAIYRCEASNAATESPLTAQIQLIVYFPPDKATISGNTLAKAGEELELTCITSNSNPPAVISWFAPGKQLSSSESTVTPSDKGGFITTSVIRVRLTNREDNVVYTCQAVNDELTESATDTITLSVLYPPGKPIIQGYEVGDFIKAGDRKRLSCSSAGGNPKATITWYRDGTALVSTTKTRGNIVTAELTVDIKASDNGAEYKCKATNEATTTPLETSIDLTVYFPPAGVNITADPEQAKAGSRLQLKCVSSSSNPPAAIKWVRENVLIEGLTVSKTPSTYGGMTTTNVLEVNPTAADHQAEYYCQAKNLIIGDMVNNAITLNVLFKPVFEPAISPAYIEIKEGENRVVNLTAAANPPEVTYQFYKDGAQISAWDIGSFAFDHGVLTITNVQRSHIGHYMLEATNNEGTSNFNFTLNVQYPAEITTINPSRRVLKDIGDTAFFHCVVDANPVIPNMVEWSRADFDMTKTTDDGKGHLSVYGLDKEDTGEFTCTADNRLGQPATMTAMLIVKFAPTIDKSQQYSKAAGDHGSTVQLICKAQGAPEITFSWSKNNEEVSGFKYQIDTQNLNDLSYKSVLKVRDVSSDDYATYKCTATNEKGVDTFEITMDGTSQPDQPYDLMFVNATHETITFSWTPGFNGGLPQKFQVRYQQKNRKGFTYIDITPEDVKHTTFFTIKGLQRGTEYEITVLTSNPLGPAKGSSPVITIKTLDTAPSHETSSSIQNKDDTPVIIILVVCVVGIFLLALNIGLILFFVRRRKKRLENNSDTTSHTNTIELYGPTKEMALYPITPSDDSRSYGTYEKNMDDFSDDYKNFEGQERVSVTIVRPKVRHPSPVVLHLYGDEDPRHDQKSMHSSNCNCHCVKVKVKTISQGNCCLAQDSSGDEDIKRVFLPPPGYTSRSYTPNKMDSPQMNSHRTFLTDSHTYLDDADRQAAQWRYEDPYKSRNKGTFDSDYLEQSQKGSSAGLLNDYDGRQETRPKSVTDFSEHSSLSSGRTGVRMTPPPPPPVRSSSKGVAGNYSQSSIPPIPARNYDLDDLPPPIYDDSLQPRYVPPPGSLGSYSNNPNVITNPHYDGPRDSPLHRSHIPVDDMRGDLV